MHLGEFPDARSLRLVLDSQRIVSRDAATFDTRAAMDWSRRASTYLRVIRATNDVGGMVGNGGPAAGEAALAASRVEQFARAVQTGNDTADSGPLRHLAHLGREIDERITQLIQHGAHERHYFARVPIPHIDTNAGGIVKTTRHRYAPITADITPELVEIVRDELRPKPPAPTAPKKAAASRNELTAAVVHRPEPRNAQPGLSV